MQPQTSANVIFFDGLCSLCDSIISRLVPYAERANFKFSSLQGETFKEVLARHPELSKIDSVILVNHLGQVDQEKITYRSDAALKILSLMGGFFKLFSGFGRLFPRPLRDAIYNFIARNRTRFFPARDTCRLPTPQERALFLP